MPSTASRIAPRMLTYHSVSLARTVSSIRIARVRAQRVAGAAARLNQLDGSAVVDLATQALDVDLNEVRHRIEAVVPDVFGDIASGHDLLLAPGQVFEERVLLGGQRDWLAAARDISRAGVDHQIINRQLRGLKGRAPPQQRADASQQLRKVIGLRQVVVGAGVETLDALVEAAARGQHQYRNRRVVRSQLPAEIEAVEAWQQHVE